MTRWQLGSIAALAVMVSLLFGSVVSAKDDRKLAVFNWHEVVDYLVEQPYDESKFTGPEGDAIREKIEGLYEDMDDLDDDEFMKRQQEIRSLRKELMGLRPHPKKISRKLRKDAIKVIEEYTIAKGYDIAYSVESINDKHLPVVWNVEMTDITDDLIDQLAKQGMASREGPHVEKAKSSAIKIMTDKYGPLFQTKEETMKKAN